MIRRDHVGGWWQCGRSDLDCGRNSSSRVHHVRAIYSTQHVCGVWYIEYPYCITFEYCIEHAKNIEYEYSIEHA